MLSLSIDSCCMSFFLSFFLSSFLPPFLCRLFHQFTDNQKTPDLHVNSQSARNMHDNVLPFNPTDQPKPIISNNSTQVSHTSHQSVTAPKNRQDALHPTPNTKLPDSYQAAEEQRPYTPDQPGLRSTKTPAPRNPTKDHSAFGMPLDPRIT
jgi:hypothetical protein